ncbi:MAG TPA: pepsin-like aspartic protease [Kofleriaceae bacterium]|jgi:hypothetical protein
MRKLIGTALFVLSACGGGGDDGNNTGDGGGGDDAGSGSHVDAPRGDAPPSGNPVAVPLVGEEIVYAGPMTIGGQTFQAIFDTGSSSIGVAGASCTTCGVSPEYTPGASATDTSHTASSQYGDGSSWTGEIYQDMLALGTAGSVGVKFAEITHNSNFFRGDEVGLDYQGIVGLGPDAALLSGTTGYMTALAATGVDKEFAFQLCPTTGTLWVGGYDPSATSANPVFTPIVPIVGNSVLYHAVAVDDASVGGTDLQLTAASFGPTIIDTGTSISFVPSATLTKLTAAINASAGYSSIFTTPLQAVGNDGQPHCVSTSHTAAEIDAALPTLSFTFGGATTPVTLPATQSYLYFGGANQWCYGFGNSSAVFGGSISASLLGDNTLHGVVAVFDLANNQIGFAPQVGCDSTARAAHTPKLRLPPRRL